MSERDKLIELIIASVDGCAEYWAARIADHLLTNGVRVPVSCGECRYYDFKHPETMEPWGVCERSIYNATDADDFCKYGERRADNEETLR